MIWTRRMSYVIFLSIVLLFNSVPLPISAVPPTYLPEAQLRLPNHGSETFANPTNSTVRADPIPAGCIGVTPPGAPEALCCISGFVYIDGQIVTGAEVMITTMRGDQVTLFTQVLSGSVVLPHYRLNLNTPPLNVIAGETITVTARYSSHERSLAYIVKPGGQQVDVVLNRNYTDDYVYERQIWGQGEPGKFNHPKSMAISPQGNVYIVDNYNDRVQVLDNAGHYVLQWGRIGNQHGEFSSPRGIAIDQSNNVYVADAGNMRVQKFSNSGIWIESWGTDGKKNGQFKSPSGIAIDIAGHIYVTDRELHRIQKFSANGKWLQTWGQQGSANGHFLNPNGIAIDRHGNIYVVDTDNHRVQKFNSQGVWLSSWGNIGSDQGQFRYPEGITIDSFGNVYVGDTNNHRVQVFNENGTWLRSWGVYGSENGQFNTFMGFLASDSNNYIYIADAYIDRIQKFTSIGDWQATFGEHSAALGQFQRIRGISIDNNQNIYAIDNGNNRVQKFTNNGFWSTNWGVYGSENGQFVWPRGIATDSINNIYVIDSITDKVQKFTANGNWLKTFGGSGSSNGKLANPEDIAIDVNGNIYIADTDNHRIQKFNSSGTWVATWGSQGTNNGQFNRPKGIAVDQDGIVYIADTDNHRIQKFTSSGDWIESWGQRGSDNGQFNFPQGISVDNTGLLYVTESYSSRIQKFNTSGSWIMEWGRTGVGDGELSFPDDIKFDQANRIYVSDTYNNRIQIFHSMDFTQPIATINHVESTTLTPNDTLKAWGIGQDSDQTPAINAYRWTSNRDGIIGTTPVLARTASSLSHGTHAITLEVQDSEGQWSAPVTTSVYVAPPAQFAWTMMLYLAGDYHDGGRLLNDFNRAIGGLQQSFRNPAVRIVVQIDGRGHGDTRRLLITPGTASMSPQIEEMPFGEEAMDNPITLMNFIAWGQQTFPANHYYLAIADHGQGAQGIAWDTTSDRYDDGVQNDSAYLTPTELHTALGAPNIAPIDILHLDACSMNLLEVAYEVRNNADILIASQYLGWSYFAYADYQRAMSDTSTPQEVAIEIAWLYAVRANDDQHPYTISALNMARAESTLAAVDSLAAEMAALLNNNQSNQALVYTIWQTTQRFESNGDYVINELDMYIDLVDWASRVQSTISSPAIKNRATNLINELTGLHPFIITGSNRYRSDTLPPQYADGSYINLNNAHGLSLFYPGASNSTVYDAYINDRIFNFTNDSRWRDFLIAGVGSLSPQPPLGSLPGPLQPLSSETNIYIPLVVR